MTTSLTIFDIDDTLFHTTSSVYVMRGERIVQKLNAAEFNVYKLKTGEHLDFREFRSAAHFAATASPIANMFTTAKKMMKHLPGPDTRFIIITARADMDDKQLFVDTFRKYGFDIDRSHIYRAGNIAKPGAIAKKQIIHRELKKYKYDIVRMFDDAKANLDKFIELRIEFPKTSFEAFLIHEDGRITRYRG